MSLARRAVSDIVERKFGVACGVIADEVIEVELAPGADDLKGDHLFEIGSITKTFTATLAAYLVGQGKTDWGATIGGLIGDLKGRPAGAITLEQLAKHTSGLPRLPPNIIEKGKASPDDPYRDYSADDLLEALMEAEPGAGRYEYSNFGYMVLGYLIGVIAGTTFGELAKQVIFEPLEMRGAQVSVHGATIEGVRMPGYRGTKVVPHWSRSLAGPGGIEAGLDDMLRYIQAQLTPPESELGQAIAETHRTRATSDPVALGWQVRGGLFWHSGGTGGFSTFAGFNPARRFAIVILTNRSPSEDVDRAGYDALKGSLSI